MSRPAHRSGSGESPVIVFVGSPGRAFESAFTHADPTIRFLPRFPTQPIGGALVVRTFAIGDVSGRRAFTLAANRRGYASLGVELNEELIVIGPLTLPHRPGCGYCGAERMRAAAYSLGKSQRIVRDRNKGHTSAAGAVLVREIRAALRSGLHECPLLDHVLVVRAREVSLHRSIPLPRCRLCGSAVRALPARAAQPLSATSRPERVFEALSGWVDEWTGVISTAVLEQKPDARLPHVVTTAPVAFARDDGSLRLLPLGWGKGLTVSGAVLSAVGEAIERYAASLPDPSRIVWKRSDELQGDYLDPRKLALYSRGQYQREDFPFARFRPHLRHPWVRGTWLGTRTPVWVPAILVFLSLTLEPEQLICQGTSNGLAAAHSLDEAALRATFELIERDALLGSWLTARPGRRLELDGSCEPQLRQIVDAIESLGATVELSVLATGAYGSTVLCLGLGDGTRYPGVTIALGAGIDVRSALHSALLELGQTGPFLQRMMQSHAIPLPRQPTSVRTMLDHAAYYFPRQRAQVFDRLRSTTPPVKLRDLPSSRPRRTLHHCAAALAAAGIRVAIVDVTTADVAEGPFRVARAVSPDLQPLSYGFGMDRLPVPRIRALGLRQPLPPVQPLW